MVIASPQLVEGMLPENGGELAVAVSAAEHHTAVITEQGHLFTWGATFGKNVLGHEGVRWQPSPKQVAGIHRAVTVAAAKEHNVVLMGTNFPKMSPSQSSLLETLAAQQVARHVDLFNVIPILITAERVECTYLKEYCNEFIRLNLDAVLNVGRKSEMNVFLNEQLAAGFDEMERDTECHPLIYDVIMAGTTSSVREFDSDEWMEACKSLRERLPVSTLVKYRQSSSNGTGDSVIARRALSRRRTLSFNGDDDNGGETDPGECSERCLMLTANMNLKTCDVAQSKVNALSKEIRSVKKLLNQIGKLQLAESLTPEQEQKVQRKALLETDLALLEPALANAESKLQKLRLEEKVVDLSSSFMEDIKEEESIGTPESTPTAADIEAVKEFDAPENDTVETAVQVFRCDLCSVSCADANSLALHKNGRKHRNRVAQAEEEEKKQTAASILEDRRRQMLLSKDDVLPPPSPKASAKKAAWKKPTETVQPRYRLPPPPHFPALGEAAAVTASPPTKPARAAWNKPGTALPLKSVPAVPAASRSSNLLSPGDIPALASPPWASPAARVPPARSSSRADESKKTYSLGDFLHTPSPPVEKKPSVSPWSASPKASKQASPSFMDIQEQEEAMRSKEPSRVEGKWYVDQRVRASSISAIQEAEKKNREHELFVEEQKRIEAEIMRERQQAKSRKPRKRRPRKQTKGNDAVSAGDGASADDSGKKQAGRGGGRNPRPSNRKRSNAGES